MVSRPKVVELPAVRYVGPVPAGWLDDTPVPAAPAPDCRDAATGEPVLCNRQVEQYLRRALAAVGLCNADKADAREWQAKRIEEAAQAAKAGGR